MSKKVIFITDVTIGDNCSEVVTDDVLLAVKEFFPAGFPKTAKIYNNKIAEENDVTPRSKIEIESFHKLKGTFYVVVTPGDPITIFFVVAVSVVATAAFFLRPQIPNVATQTGAINNASPNNSLTSRTNSARINKRIPDIVGRVRSIPDLIALTYTYYVSDIEHEVSLLCIGRGEYEVHDARDGDSLIVATEGALVEVFGPDTSPVDGTPQDVFGKQYFFRDRGTFGTNDRPPILDLRRLTAFNGQELAFPSTVPLSQDNLTAEITAFRGIDVTGGAPVLTYEATVHLNGPVDVSDYVNESTYFVDNINVGGVYTGEMSGTDTSPTVTFDPPEDNALVQQALAEALADSAEEVQTVSLRMHCKVRKVLGSLKNRFELEILGAGSFAPLRALSPWLYIRDASDPDHSTVRLSKENGMQMRNRFLCTDVPGNTDGKRVRIDYDRTLSTSIFLGPSYGYRDKVAELQALFNAGDPDGTEHTAVVDFSGEIVNTKNGTSSVGIGATGIETTTGSVRSFSTGRAGDTVLVNFVAPSGLYSTDTTNGRKRLLTIDVEVKLTPIDDDFNSIGPAEIFTGTTPVGNGTPDRSRGFTMVCSPTFFGKFRIEIKRVTPEFTTGENSYQQTLKVKDVFVGTKVENGKEFGNVTTVYAVTEATEGALALKERRLNLDVTRKLSTLNADGTVDATLSPTLSAKDIFLYLSVDPFIGRRALTELDLQNISDTVAEVGTYFGTERATEFSYTFDETNISYEETAAIVANTMFSTAYRRGSKIGLFFERPTDTSTLLLNHRNKVPGTELRTISFGIADRHDGVQYTYTDPDDGTIKTLHIPADQSATNPKVVEGIGVRNHLLAYFHLHRAHRKIVFQNMAVSATVTSEADLLVLRERMLFADNTRTGTQDGEVLEQNGLTLTLSQDVEFDGGKTYSIFLQHKDYTVESIPVVAGAKSNEVVLQNAPRLELRTDPNLYARTTYQVVGAGETNSQPFLLMEKGSLTNLTLDIAGVNYTDEYYVEDDAFKTGRIDENATPLP